MQSAAAVAVASRTLASSGAAAMTAGAASANLGQAFGGAASPVASTADGSGGSTGQSLEQTLLAWCRQATAGYAGVNVRDLSTSFRDGLAFNAIIHRYRPDLFDFAEVASAGDAECALAHAFQVAHDQLGIDRLLDPEGMRERRRTAALDAKRPTGCRCPPPSSGPVVGNRSTCPACAAVLL